MEKILNSESETDKIANFLFQKIKNNPKKNHVIALTGDLGSGKTKFTQLFAKKLGIKKNVLSPTFLIIKKYKIPLKNFKHLFHIDAYRLKNEEQLQKIGFNQLINNKNIIIIEWADKVKKIIPNSALWISFQHGINKNQRIIKIKNE